MNTTPIFDDAALWAPTRLVVPRKGEPHVCAEWLQPVGGMYDVDPDSDSRWLERYECQVCGSAVAL